MVSYTLFEFKIFNALSMQFYGCIIVFDNREAAYPAQIDVLELSIALGSFLFSFSFRFGCNDLEMSSDRQTIFSSAGTTDRQQSLNSAVRADGGK